MQSSLGNKGISPSWSKHGLSSVQAAWWAGDARDAGGGGHACCTGEGSELHQVLPLPPLHSCTFCLHIQFFNFCGLLEKSTIPTSLSILYTLLLSEYSRNFSYTHRNHKEPDGTQIKRKVHPRLCGKNM